MTTSAAVIAVVVSLFGGYYFAQWRRSEGSLKSAKALTEGAGRAAGRARRAMLLVALVIAAVAYVWIHGKGHLRGPRPSFLAAVFGGRQQPSWGPSGVRIGSGSSRAGVARPGEFRRVFAAAAAERLGSGALAPGHFVPPR